MIVALVLSVPFIYILATKPVLRRLAVRNAIRRPRETMLVIAGSLLGTALMTASFVVGDTLTASISATAHTQYGPVDEVVSVLAPQAPELRRRIGGFQNSLIDGVLPITTLEVAAATVEPNNIATAAAPKAQLLEVDFNHAAIFGHDAPASGLSGQGPGAGEAVVVEALANRLHLHGGDTFSVFALGQNVRLRVARIIPQLGVAGFWRGREVVSYNAFVSPGTIALLAAHLDISKAGPRSAALGELPLYSMLISNRGGVESGAALSTAVVRALRQPLAGMATNVLPAKKNLLDAARKAGDGLQQLYQTIGTFAVFAGILLLINIFTMLADERKSELGMMRAMGLRRRSLVATFASEGWLYGIVACAIGTVVGLGIGRLVIEGASQITASANKDLRAPIKFHFTPTSLQSGFAIGLTITIATVIGTSISTSRFNIISAIRDLERSKVRGGGVRAVIGGVTAAIGALLTVVGFAAVNALPILAGPALLALGAATFLNRRRSRRPVTTVFAAFAIAWGASAVPIAIGFGAEPQVAAFLIQGLIMVIPAVILLSEYQNEVGHVLARLTGRRLSVRLGLAYPLARRQRTALTLAQFSIVVFILTYITTLSTMFQGQAAQFTSDLGGGYNVVVDANPINVDALRNTAGVEIVAPLWRNERASITPSTSNETSEWPMAGIDASFLRTQPPKITDTGSYPNQTAVYQALIHSDHFAIIDDRFLSRGGPPASPVGIGDSILVKDPASGGSKRLTIIAKASNDVLFNGGWTSAQAMRAIFGVNAIPTRAYIKAVDPERFASAIESSDFRSGAQAVTINGKVKEQLAQQNKFFSLIRSFLSIGLVVGVAGIGVIMVRAVRERRRQVGVLRALGFPADSVSNAFAIEAGFVALEGIFIGVALGLISTWTITLSDNFGRGLTFVVPVVALLVLVFGTLIGSLIATVGPARSAAKIKPAVALRMTD